MTLTPFFQVTGRQSTLTNDLLASDSLMDGIDFNQTCIAISLGDEKELIRFLVILISFLRSLVCKEC